MNTRRSQWSGTGWRIASAATLVVALFGWSLTLTAGSAMASAIGGYQIVPGDQPSVAVLGTGEASAAAESGTLQLILRAVDPFALPMEPSATQVEAPLPPGQVPSLTDDQLQPILDALTGAGVATDQVTVTMSAGFNSTFGSGAAELLVELDDAGLSQAGQIVDAAREAAAQNGLYVESTGADYRVDDCDNLIDQARAAAAADGEQRARALAAVLNLELGTIILASETPYFDGGSGFSCSIAPVLPNTLTTYYPAFDPNTPPEVRVYAQINLAYAIVDSTAP